MNHWHFALALTLVTASVCAAEPALPPSNAAEYQALSKELQQARMRPRIEFSGRFEFAEADDEGTLQPRSSSDFLGTIDLATQQCRFEFKGYRRPILNAPKPFDVSDFIIVFDGAKWQVTRTPQDRTGLPAGINSLTEVTTERPAMFLATLDPLCFPLFEQLLELKINGRLVPLLTILNNPLAPGQNVTLTRTDEAVTLEVKSGCILHKIVLDPNRAHTLVRRDTDYNACDPVVGAAPPFPGGRRQPKVRNETIIKEHTEVGGLWFPKVAVFRTLVDDTVTIERKFAIDKVTIVDKTTPSFIDHLPQK